MSLTSTRRRTDQETAWTHIVLRRLRGIRGETPRIPHNVRSYTTSRCYPSFYPSLHQWSDSLRGSDAVRLTAPNPPSVAKGRENNTFWANAGRAPTCRAFLNQVALRCMAATTAPPYPEQVFDQGNREFIVLLRLLLVGMADGSAGWIEAYM